MNNLIYNMMKYITMLKYITMYIRMYIRIHIYIEYISIQNIQNVYYNIVHIRI